MVPLCCKSAHVHVRWMLGALVALVLQIVSHVSGQTPVISDLQGYPGKGYSLAVGIGTPPQTLRVILDTGSSNFAVASKSNPSITNYFRTAQSQTFQPSGTQVSVSYTEGYWKGQLATDKLNISSFPSVTVSLVTIDESQDFFVLDAAWEGILGLAYPSLAKPDSSVSPVFNTLVQSGVVTSNMFSMQLCGTTKKGQTDIATGGKLVLDGLSTTLYRGSIFYTPIERTDYYEVTISEVAVNGVELTDECTQFNNPRTIVDSGTTGLRFPTAIFNQIVTKMRNYSSSNAHESTKPCSDSDEFWQNKGACCVLPSSTHDLFSSFPNITIYLPVNGRPNEDFKLTIPSQLYLQAVPSSKRDRDCYKFFILPSDSGSVLGAVVMEGYYVIFDRQNKQIGFAESTCVVIASEFYKPSVLGPYGRRANVSCLYVPAPASNTARDTLIGVGVGVGVLVLIVGIACWVVSSGKKEPDAEYSLPDTRDSSTYPEGTYRSGDQLIDDKTDE